MKKRIAVLLSGHGSNLEALADSVAGSILNSDENVTDLKEKLTARLTELTNKEPKKPEK
jgi:folate-dependent phosphoribosylglycinamide formyltransferase PurN